MKVHSQTVSATCSRVAVLMATGTAVSCVLCAHTGSETRHLAYLTLIVAVAQRYTNVASRGVNVSYEGKLN